MLEAELNDIWLSWPDVFVSNTGLIVLVVRRSTTAIHIQSVGQLMTGVDQLTKPRIF